MKFRSSELNGERATITNSMPITFRWRAALVILVAVLVRATLVVAVDTGKLRVEFNPDFLRLFLLCLQSRDRVLDLRTRSMSSDRFRDPWNSPPGDRRFIPLSWLSFTGFQCVYCFCFW